MNKPLLAIFFTVGVVTASCGAQDGARESSSDSEPVNQDAAGSPVSGSEIATTQINVGDFVFDVRTAGPEDGEVVILLHGFHRPLMNGETSFARSAPQGSARWHQTSVATQRGARPDGIEPYAIPLLVSDVLGLADAVDADRFHIVGHDWGAVVAWALAAAAPSRVITANPVSVPHPDAFSRVLNDPTSCQPEASAYFDLFVQPDSEDGFLADDNAGLRAIYAGIDGGAIDEYVRVLGSKPALGAALNWYRANVANRDLPGPPMGPTTVPTMFTWSDGDTALCVDGARLTAEYVEGPYRFEVLEGVSHWIPDLAAEQMSLLLVDHISSYTDR